MSTTTGTTPTPQPVAASPAPPAATPGSAPPPPPSSFDGFWAWASAREDAGQLASRALLIMIGGIAAFSVLSGLALLLGAIFDFVLSLVGGTADGFSSSVSLATPVLLRGGELFLTLAAALLVFLIILTRSNDAILSLLGVLVIAAIIIPAADLIRLGSVFGMADSDRDLQAFRASSEGESVTYDRSDLFAKRIVSRAFDTPEFERYLNQTRSADAATATAGQRRMRSYLEAFIAEESYLFQVERLETSVRQRGIARLLIEVLDADRARQMTMMPATIRTVRAELIALRDLGLVSASQADFQNLAITALGVEVACRVAPENLTLLARVAEDRRRGIPRNLPTPRSPDCRVPRQPATSTETEAPGAPRVSTLAPRPATASQQIDVPVARIRTPEGHVQQVAVPRNGIVAFRVTILEATRGLTIAAGTRDSTRLDPVITVVDAAGQEIASDDDSGGGFEAFLTIALPGPGAYEFRLRDFGSGSGNTTMFLRQANQDDERRAITGRQPRLAASVADRMDPCPTGLVPSSSDGVRISLRGGTALFRCTVPAGSWTFDVNGGGADLLLALYRRDPTGNFTQVAFSDDREQPAQGRALDPLIHQTLDSETELAFFLRDITAQQNREALLSVTRRSATPAITPADPAPQQPAQQSPATPGRAPAPR